METLLKNRKGVTLIELLIVLITIGTLAAIAIPSYRYFLDLARLTTSISALDTVRKEMDAYLIDRGSYPASIDFTDFTDQNGEHILNIINFDAVKNKVYSVDQYTVTANSYTLTAKAMDSKHTIVTVTPNGVTH